MNDLSNLDIRTAIIESILKTFDTMLSLDVEYSEVESPVPFSLAVIRMVF